VLNAVREFVDHHQETKGSRLADRLIDIPSRSARHNWRRWPARELQLTAAGLIAERARFPAYGDWQ
jgi:hypothetical protein